jgi:predicted MFS family arabinose efflux permease
MEEKTEWKKVFVIVSTGVIAATQVGKVIIKTADLSHDFQLNMQSVGWALSIFSILGAIACAPVGGLVQYIGDRRLVLFGLVATTAGGIAGAISGSFSILLFSRSIEGIGFLFIIVAAPSVLQRMSATKDSDLVMGLWSSFMPAGLTIAMLAGPAFEDWRTLWWVSAAVTMGMLVLVLFTIPKFAGSNITISVNSVFKSLIAGIKAPGIFSLVLLFVIYNVMYLAVIGFLPLLLEQQLQLPLQYIGVLSSVIIAANIIGNIAAGMLLKRGAAYWKLLAFTCVVMGVSGFFIFRISQPAAVVVILCVVFSAIGGIVPATILSTAPRLVASSAFVSISIGLTMQGSNIGQVMGPVIIGVAVDRAGWAAASIIVAVVAALGLLLSVRLKTKPVPG